MIIIFLAYVVGLGLLLGLSAFFSGSETAIFSLGRAQVQRLRKSGTKTGEAVAALLDRPRRLLITILVGNMLVNVATAAILADVAKRVLGDRGVGAAIFVTTFLLLIAGEVTPKTLAVRHAEGFARTTALPLGLFARAIWPLRILLRGVTTAILFVLRQGRVQSDSLTRDDLQAIVRAGAAEGVVEEHETEIVENIFGFREITAHEIMVPRTDVVGLEEAATIREALAAACQAQHSRIPIYREHEDDVWGVFHLKDMPAWAAHDILDMPIRGFVAHRDAMDEQPKFPLVHDAYLAPEAARIDTLFECMRDRRTHMAVLLDEYGGTAGIVTLGDVLEQLVGELTEEEPDTDDYRREGHVILASGQAKIREINDDLDLDIPLGVADTVAGYVLELLSDMPEAGQTVADDALEFTVTEVTPKRIERVEIRRLPSEDDDGEEGSDGHR